MFPRWFFYLGPVGHPFAGAFCQTSFLLPPDPVGYASSWETNGPSPEFEGVFGNGDMDIEPQSSC